MGVENHNAVIATTWNSSEVERIKAWIETLPTDFASLFAVVPALANCKVTVVMCPDGSKEGWTLSQQGDMLRQQFIEQIKISNYGDGSSPWEWIEVGYGEYGQAVLAGNNHNMYSDAEYLTNNGL